MAKANSPLFLRKLVGHTRTVFSLIKYRNDFILSFDGNGLCRIWDSVNYQFIKAWGFKCAYLPHQSFSTGCKFPSNSQPVIWGDKLLAVEQNSVFVCPSFPSSYGLSDVAYHGGSGFSEWEPREAIHPFWKRYLADRKFACWWWCKFFPWRQPNDW